MDPIQDRLDQLKLTINDLLHEYAALHAIVEACNFITGHGDSFSPTQIADKFAAVCFDQWPMDRKKIVRLILHYTSEKISDQTILDYLSEIEED